jgi:transcriptional regulator with XRE-family HTH domain
MQLGLDIRAVNRWERGGIAPSRENLAKLSDLLGHDIAWYYTNHAPEPTRGT